MSQLWGMLVVLGLTSLSGVLDARGFIYASRAWPDGQFDLRWGASAVVTFIGGMSCYVLAVRFMNGLGVQGAALQSALWFVMTAVGVAVMDASILNWTRTQQVVAMLVAVGLGWLLATTAAAKA
jgi:hypothetical protein